MHLVKAAEMPADRCFEMGRDGKPRAPFLWNTCLTMANGVVSMHSQVMLRLPLLVFKEIRVQYNTSISDFCMSGVEGVPVHLFRTVCTTLLLLFKKIERNISPQIFWCFLDTLKNGTWFSDEIVGFSIGAGIYCPFDYWKLLIHGTLQCHNLLFVDMTRRFAFFLTSKIQGWKGKFLLDLICWVIIASLMVIPCSVALVRSSTSCCCKVVTFRKIIR